MRAGLAGRRLQAHPHFGGAIAKGLFGRFPIDQEVRYFLVLLQGDSWLRARETGGSVYDGAWACELARSSSKSSALTERTRLMMQPKCHHPPPSSPCSCRLMATSPMRDDTDIAAVGLATPDMPK